MRTAPWLSVLLILLLKAPAIAAAGELIFEVEAPPELAAEAERLETLQSMELGPFLDLIGLTGVGDPIRVVLVPEGSILAARVPPWIAGFARGDESTVVLFPERVPAYPYSSFPELVRHEVAHVLLHRASNGRSLPRWFNEGLAMTAEGSWRLADRSRLAMAMLRSREPTLDELSALFAGDAQRIAWAYAVSGALARDVLRRRGRSHVAGLLREVGQGVDFDDAFERSFDLAPGDALASFWHRSAVWYRWLPFLTSSTVLWIAVTLLALIAIKRRRERDRQVHAAWEAEEKIYEGAPDDLVN